MLFYYVRHGEPIYEPNDLTPLGYKQADDLAKRFDLYGLDEIYCSPSNRAFQTAKPTCDLLKKEVKFLDWTDERHSWKEFTVEVDGRKSWVFQSPKHIELLYSQEIRQLGKYWYSSPDFGQSFQMGMQRIDGETDAFFQLLGFKHDRTKGGYAVVKPNGKRIALFAHQGFGLAFLSSVLDIPYPIFCTRFDMGHSAVTVLYFDEKEKFAYPKVLQWANDSHLYKDGILTPYQNWIDI